MPNSRWWCPLPAVEPGLHRIDVATAAGEAGLDVSRWPRCLLVLAENVLRHAVNDEAGLAGLRALAGRDPGAEIPFRPARVLLQDFTGVPCVADLAALRDAVRRAGRAAKVEPEIPVDLVIDHSVQLDATGSPEALAHNMRLEFERNRERYELLRWGCRAFSRLRVIPPGVGICHQVNMEHLAEVVCVEDDPTGIRLARPDSVVGTDSHTTMINSLCVLGWGVGGIEAEAAMLGHAISLAPPRTVGVRVIGALGGGATATDAALALTRRLREVGVVECFVEFFGPGLPALSVEDRAPLANMAPEYGATTGFFPVDEATLRYLRLTGRPEDLVRRVASYARESGLWHDPAGPAPVFDRVVEFDLGTVEPSVAGPRRPHEWQPLRDVGRRFEAAMASPDPREGFGVAAVDSPAAGGVDHGSVVLASITSCTNTSNPALLIAAGLLARRAASRGLRVPPHVTTSFAPGSRAAVAFLRRAEVLADLERLGFHVAAYGCAACIGNSGPLRPEVEEEIRRRKLVVAAVLSGNRNFEGRVHPLTRANYLCSPPLVVAYALRGTVRGDLTRDPIGLDLQGRPVTLHDLWPSAAEVAAAVAAAVCPEDFRSAYAPENLRRIEWEALPDIAADVYPWDPASTYIRRPPFLDGVGPQPAPLEDIREAAILGLFGDFITTDHISPAGRIATDSPAARYLAGQGVPPSEFNTYGARRGNHEVMVRGTFGNPRLRNRMVDQEGNRTLHWPDGRPMSFFEAAEEYRRDGVPLVVVAGRMYGAGSSRDWAAKGVALLGVRAVLAASFERIHRSNLVELGVLPVELPDGLDAEKLGLTGRERVTLAGLPSLMPGGSVRVILRRSDGTATEFDARARVDNAQELEFFRHGGLLPYVFRSLLRGA